MVTLRHGVNAYCDEAQVQSIVCVPGSQLPPDTGEGSERDKVRQAIADTFVEMQEARASAGLTLFAADAIHIRQARHINSVGAAARYLQDADLRAQYEQGLDMWAPPCEHPASPAEEPEDEPVRVRDVGRPSKLDQSDPISTAQRLPDVDPDDAGFRPGEKVAGAE